MTSSPRHTFVPQCTKAEVGTSFAVWPGQKNTSTMSLKSLPQKALWRDLHLQLPSSLQMMHQRNGQGPISALNRSPQWSFGQNPTLEENIWIFYSGVGECIVAALSRLQWVSGWHRPQIECRCDTPLRSKVNPLCQTGCYAVQNGGLIWCT